MKTVRVSIPKTFHDAFHYEWDEVALKPGMRVWVPFRGKKRLGVVIGEGYFQDKKPLKSILEVIDEVPLLSKELLSLCHFVSLYYQSPLSEVFALALPKRLRDGKPLVMPKQKATSVTQRALLQAAPLLTIEQRQVLEVFAAKKTGYHCFLLEGVTGSGKTEIYFQLITRVIDAGKQALILVPEIALTPQLITRFQSRFDTKIVMIHSQLSEVLRYRAYDLAKTGEARIVIGTRSAIFTPMPELGLLIVDEEHDLSFKQMEGVRYSARDLAVVRAKKGHFPIILGSATPSLESLYHALEKKYTHLRLTQKAMESPPLHYELIDLRQETLRDSLSKRTLAIISRHLQQGFQVLVFINRRGFSPVMLCHHCGFIESCWSCDSHLTFHKKTGRLLCHHCGRSRKFLPVCAKCSQSDMIPVGVGTERVVEVLKDAFPEFPVLKFDRDEIKKKSVLDAYLDKIEREEVSLIVGTQMLAKGHHFPKLTLTVILDADFGLTCPDFRALEQFGQLLLQVSGRAGREKHQGTVLIQTHYPDHPLLNCLIKEGYCSFAKALLNLRKEASFPPYGYLALIRVSHPNEARVMSVLMKIKVYLSEFSLKLMGPQLAPMPKKASLYRGHLLIQSSQRSKIQHALTSLRAWLTINKFSGGCRVSMDVDPLDLS